ncbi:hypothetical protein [Candidatus Tisiphia endosymbiont of Beris chalybata]|uniref:hypothetical protein n=1 Tax=Candidatus Tisiphia endosymbiont of Beris chalybata TaxID=3066262 RepID=UPI00312CB86F
MQIVLSNNIENLGSWSKQDHINIKLLNVFELMAVLNNVYISVVNTQTAYPPKITFSEFCIINCLTETISNKLANKLFKTYTHNESLREIIKKISLVPKWDPVGDPSVEPTTNCSTCLNNHDNLFTYIKKNFFANKLFIEITGYCSNLLIKRGQILELPQIIGEIDVFYSPHLNIYLNTFISLTTPLQKVIVDEDLYKLLCCHSILFENISHDNSFEAKAILAHTTQVCGTCLALITEYQRDSDTQKYIDSKLINIIKYSYIVNSLKFITSDAIKPLLNSWYKELKTFLYFCPGEEFYNDLKNLDKSIITLTPAIKLTEERIDITINSLFLTIDHLTQEEQIEGRSNVIGDNNQEEEI